MAAENKPNPELTKVDQAIAADADALLQGDFETIDAVLEGVFEEQAALVQMDDKSPAANPKATASSRAAAPLAPNVPNVPTSIAPQPVEVAVSAPVVEEQSAEAHVAPAVVVESISHAAPEASPPQRPSHQLEPIAAAGPAQPATAPAARRPLLGMLKKAAISGLVIANYPLRLVPAGQRPMVDWVALSLMGWVPVVWILALTLGHKNAHVQASPEVHEAGSVLATTEVEDKAMHQAVTPGEEDRGSEH